MACQDHDRRACRVLIVEDEYFLAADLELALREEGAQVVGPIADLSAALAQVDRDGFDAAVLDINLHDEHAYSIADKLVEHGVPFVFATGYSAEVLPDRFSEVERFEKPYDVHAIAKKIAELGRLRRDPVS
ncbi:response regulator [Bradyrhizobium sp. 195]|uniref:response regulator n=1 Tax=Bradyrhizobium sp. 195 TaxID=2782662 RepID=UPI0020016975|nr:response regulator [Bradyrhizobium sp. 195]UPK23860.1 response regulator [Bradyrhizobium sp. 195]